MKVKSIAALALLAGLAWAASPRFRLVSKQLRSYTAARNFPGLSAKLEVDRAANRITASAPGEYQVTARAGPSSDMMSFEIAGMKNPEIRIPQGTQLTLTVINVDDDMAHNLALTTAAPPYPKLIAAPSIASPTLKSHEGQAWSAAILTFRATGVGPAYYLCTVPGHAKAGMFGKITVLP
ncbi:MAG: plastocyanin/azurin family copper-binding protein [Terriglobales bacterium]